MSEPIRRRKSPQKIVFIHGNSSASNYWDTAMKSDVLTDYKCFALDLPGHGASSRSDCPERDYSLQGMAQFVSKYLREEIKDDYILVGHCLGTNIIGECDENLSHCKGVFLTNPTILGKGILPSDVLQSNPLITSYFTATFTDNELEKLCENVIIKVNEKTKKKFFDNFKTTDPMVRTTVASAVASSEYSDEITTLEKQNIPLAIAFGQNETVCKTDYLNSANLKIWNDKIILIPNAGHYLHYDQPEVINHWLSKFAKDCFSTI
jgi:pimeloyl-ACP methyl ester carboxylesterase